MTASTTPTRPRLLLIDGHSMAYRAFHALPAERMQLSSGQYTNAVYGFTTMLLRLVQDEAPTHIAVAFDVSRRTWRTSEFPDYKASRKPSPIEFGGQVECIGQLLDALGIPRFAIDGFEADDILATLAGRGRRAGAEVLICSGDRDSFQLVDDDVTVLYPVRGVSELARMTPTAVLDKYGLTPQQYPDFAALRGDPSDNLPGIPSVGEKTATKWLQQFGTLDALLTGADSIRGKVGEALRAHIDQVRRNRHLTQLVSDVPLDGSLDDLRRTGGSPAAIIAAAEALDFHSVRDRLVAAFAGATADGEAPAVAPAAAAPPVTALDARGLRDWIAGHPRGTIAVELTGPSTPVNADATLVGLAADGDPTAVWAVVADLDPAAEAALAGLLAGTPGRTVVVHDIKAHAHRCRARGWQVGGFGWDTQVAAFVLNPGERAYDLLGLAERLLGWTPSSGPDGELALDDATPGATAGTTAAETAAAVLQVSLAQMPRAAETGAASLLADIEFPTAHMLARMEAAGIAVDAAGLADLAAEFAAQGTAAADRAYADAGRTVNLASPKQIQTLLFDELGMPKTKRTKTGYTTDAEALAELNQRAPHPFLEALLAHRDAAKLRTTVEGLIRSIADDGRIHTRFLQTIAATGRLSSTDPNLQNIPVRTAAGRSIRGCFIAGAGYDLLLTADYSQIEMRIMAHLSGDESLITAMRAGFDVHTATAAQVFGVAPDEVTGLQRSRIKAMNYGLAYGLSAFSLARQLGISQPEAKDLMEAYYERLGGVRDYLDSVVQQARVRGYTETMFGRRRYLPQLNSDRAQLRAVAERMALNAPIQGSAADIMKIAMLEVERALREADLRARVLLQVHDELVIEAPAAEREQVDALVRETMTGAVELAVPLDVSTGWGRDWREAAH